MGKYSSNFQQSQGTLFDELLDKKLQKGIAASVRYGFSSYFIVFRDVEISEDSIIDLFKNNTNHNLIRMSTIDLKEQSINDILENETAILYDDLGMVLIKTNHQIADYLDKMGSSQRTFYLQGTQEVNILAHQSNTDTIPATYAIQKLKLNTTDYMGSGVMIAVLDTGIDLKHEKLNSKIKPDLSNTLNLVDRNKSVQDFNGHGTHCAGIVCGHFDDEGVRYGAAPESDLLVIKVTDDQGLAKDETIITAIDYAIESGCKVISISLGSEVVEQTNIIPYRRILYKAINNGCFVVAAVGNDSFRPNKAYHSLRYPATFQETIAVGAIDHDLKVMFNSNKADNNEIINYVAPGKNVLSAWSSTATKQPGNFKEDSGTSMATPYIAGILALYIEKYPRYIDEEGEEYFKRIQRFVNDRCIPLGTGRWAHESYGKGMPVAP